MSDTATQTQSTVQSLILKNAISSLRIGLEDYELSKEDPDRILSSIRNVYASLLLFLKEGLCRLSPMDTGEEFIRAKLEPILKPNRSLGVSGIGDKTIDVDGIQGRYKLVNVRIDWNPLLLIQKERNNIEHLYTNSQITVLQSAICEASTFIIDISKIVFHTDPTTLLGDVWSQICDIKDIYLPLKNRCNNSLAPLLTRGFLDQNAISFVEEFSCPDCGSKLLYLFTGPDGPSDKVTVHLEDADMCELVCYACHAKITLVEAFEKFSVENFDPSYSDYRYGAEPVVKTCPECNHDTFIDDNETNSCIFCGFEKDYTNCVRCGEPLSLEEQDRDGFCFKCDYDYGRILEDD